jgi:phosphatidylglycerol---prolipoprotein diacylglyceryl transferase
MITDLHTAAWVHTAFEYLGIATGAWLWRRQLRTQQLGGPLSDRNFAVVVGLLLGAAIGNKTVFLIERPDVALAIWHGQALWPGQSIVGGLLGGLIGVELAKWATRQTRSTGDALVVPLVAGIAIGRLGCFLAGLHDDTYGLPTTLPWGVDLGDGVLRHPSPLYEIDFLAVLVAGLWHLRQRLSAVPGLQFKLFLAAYLLWRLLGDGLKPVRQPYLFGLSGIQWTCIVALLFYAPLVWRAIVHLPRTAATRSQPTP